MDVTTIDQFAVFIAVVEEGSFAAAARRLNRTIPAVANSVNNLERLSQLSLLDRSGYRLTLTTAGQTLLPRARQLVEDVEDYSLTARGIAMGLEPEVMLTVDALVPMPLIAETLRAFHEAFPAVQMRVSLETFEAALTALSNGSADLGLIAFGHEDHDLERAVCGEIDLVPVVAPDHPLAPFWKATTPEAFRSHMQLVLSTRSSLRDRKVHGVLSANRWHLTDLETKHALLRAGLGWGLLPKHRVAADLEAGRLIELHPTRWDGVDEIPRLTFVVAHRRDRALGPAARWLFARFAEAKERRA